MKIETNNICSICREEIFIKHMLSKVDTTCFEIETNDEWFPINFQWRGLIKLKEDLVSINKY